MKNRRNYYRILHIQPDAPPDIIKASYRTQMQKLKMHPDLGGDEWDASVLNEAYRVLSDPEQRAAYDAAFLGQRHGRSTSSQTSGHRSHTPDADTRSTANGTTTDMSVCPFCHTPKPADAWLLAEPRCHGCRGPLQNAGSPRSVNPAKRACQRMPYHAGLMFYLHADCCGYQGKLRDLSPLGLQLQSPTPLVAGQVIRLVGDAVTAIGRVAFCNRAQPDGQFIAGIEFLTVSFPKHRGTFVSESA